MSDERSSGVGEAEDDGDEFIVAKTQARKKPKVDGNWSDDDVRSFIQAVEVRRALWDFGCDDYKNNVKRVNAWQSISEEFQHRFTPAVLKAKWNAIKSTYSKTKAKFQSCKSGQATNEKNLPHWSYWKDMLFIYENELANNTKSESNFEKFVDDIIIEEQSQPIATVTSAVAKQNNKRRKVLSTTPVQSQQFPISEEHVSRAVDALGKIDDEWDVFGAYIASQMRKINQQNHRLAVKLQRTINNATMDALDELDAGPSILSSTVLSNQDKWQIVSNPNLPPGAMQMIPIGQFSRENNVEISDADIVFTDELQSVAASTEKNTSQNESVPIVVNSEITKSSEELATPTTNAAEMSQKTVAVQKKKRTTPRGKTNKK